MESSQIGGTSNNLGSKDVLRFQNKFYISWLNNLCTSGGAYNDTQIHITVSA